jgi:hypothetical protein
MDFPLPQSTVARVIPKTPCARCGQSKRPMLVRYPSCTKEGIWTTIRMQVECVLCHCLTSVEFRMPRLQLGYRMLVSAEACMSLSRLCQHEYVVVEPSDVPGLDPDEDRYYELLFRTAAESMRSGCGVDWQALVGDSLAWKTFLRRGGFDK